MFHQYTIQYQVQTGFALTLLALSGSGLYAPLAVAIIVGLAFLDFFLSRLVTPVLNLLLAPKEAK